MSPVAQRLAHQLSRVSLARRDGLVLVLAVVAGLVTAEAVEKALEHQKITGYKLGDCLVELGLLQEAALLRFLAAEFNTRFVSAEKLAKANNLLGGNFGGPVFEFDF